ncbi:MULTISPECIES: DHH family phosphoesterase [Halobacteriovorax]|uniref:Bifunctional oligoribonuclease/PAP phosphatase NrnA n=1 Tax=Halobacteriovorax vibrionivorans TaxID=2152716 RepID=A0ABY0IGJ3_9BACT|nr:MULTISPECIES: bifunctional oligoribonuclease/PAP phosphatase NrnA [Halobacteriovorax]AYF43675.1 DHHA1 domain protein [Halobacteriovorax sp. BALOs_7]RZF21762.1 bifunctional oligoribonuclease/PAP phosphatase NrnA [Halobacteriovorax vibrionivorans]TGD45859.1 bifunctional oligoribonuclease/PAP phosphatase NrnA [Halobacteriovorax sp. Y22]
MTKNVERFKNLVEKANNIVITTHIFPDADGIGSEIALCMALRKLGKNAICINEEKLFDRYRYLDPDGVISNYEDSKDHFKKIDLFIVTDTNALPRIGKNVQELVLKSSELLFIDHHPCPKELAAIHCVDSTKAATGELVGELIEALGVKFDEKMALALYTSIIIDTSSFRYPTVTANTHKIASKLLDTGISPPQAFNQINGIKQVEYIKLLGQVLSSCQLSKSGLVAWISMTENDIENHNCEAEDTHGFINHLLILEGIEVACMFREIDDKVKISFRSVNQTVDVGIIAQALGGGGHNHSAATIIDGTLEKTIPEVIQKIDLMIESED